MATAEKGCLFEKPFTFILALGLEKTNCGLYSG
jgi:hypothetical protein